MTDPTTIKLQSNDGVVYDVEIKVAQTSHTIKTMLEDLGTDDCDVPIPLPNVRSEILAKVIVWSTHHKDDPPSADEEIDPDKRTLGISQWDADFLKVDNSTIFEIILAANYLDIKGLLDVACKTVANMIKGKNVEEIRKTFDIENDFTEEEEEQLRKENEWSDLK